MERYYMKRFTGLLLLMLIHGSLFQAALAQDEKNSSGAFTLG